MDYRSAIKKNGILPRAAPWVDLEVITPGEGSQVEKDEHHVSLVCGILNDTNELIHKTEADS